MGFCIWDGQPGNGLVIEEQRHSNGLFFKKKRKKKRVLYLVGERDITV